MDRIVKIKPWMKLVGLLCALAFGLLFWPVGLILLLAENGDSVYSYVMSAANGAILSLFAGVACHVLASQRWFGSLRPEIRLKTLSSGIGCAVAVGVFLVTYHDRPGIRPDSLLWYSFALGLVALTYWDLRTHRASKLEALLKHTIDQGDPQGVDLAFELGADVNAKDTNGRNSLHTAVRKGHTEVAEKLLNLGADVAARDKDARQPLHCATIQGRIGATRLLLNEGADLEPRDRDQRTPMHWAARYGHTEILWLLLRQGAQSNPRDASGRTPMHGAADWGNTGAARLLLLAAGEVNASDTLGWTPLHIAAMNGKTRMVQFLLDRSANTETQDNRGRTPLHTAAMWGRSEVAEVLIRYGAEVKAQDEDGRTPLEMTSDLPTDAKLALHIGWASGELSERNMRGIDYTETAEVLRQCSAGHEGERCSP